MKLITYFAIAAIVFSLTSCGKEYSLELADIKPTLLEQFKNLVIEKKVQLKAFYSNVPIDYIETDDTVKHETNLWPYVSNWLKDDFTSFNVNGNNVTIEQNDVKMPGLTDDVLHRNYTLTKDDNGVYVEFLDYQYHPLKYELYKVGPDYFILSVKWKNGVILFSRFELVK